MLAADIVAGLFGLEIFAVEADQLSLVLGRGVPVLFRTTEEDSWRILWWMAPDADAAIWLDYDLWREGDDDLNEPQLALSQPSDVDSTWALRLAKLSRLGSISLLQEDLARDVGWAIILAPAEDSDRWNELLPSGSATAHQLSMVSSIRRALDHGAKSKALAMVEDLGEGSAKQEILALAALDPRIDQALPEPDRGSADAAAAALLTEDALASASPWLLNQLWDLGPSNRDLECRWKATILAELEKVSRSPQRVRWARLATAIENERHDEAAEVALAVARAAAWDTSVALDVLGYLTSLPGAGTHPSVREAIAALTDHLDPFVDDPEVEMPIHRSTTAAYCAARAVLSARPDDQIRWWKRAVGLDPKQWAFRSRLADALEANGDRDEATRARVTVRSSDPAPRCRNTIEPEPATELEERAS